MLNCFRAAFDEKNVQFDNGPIDCEVGFHGFVMIWKNLNLVWGFNSIQVQALNDVNQIVYWAALSWGFG